MTEITETTDEPVSDESLWKKMYSPFVGQFKNECNMQAYELGAEGSLATYIITRFVFRRPQSAFRFSLIAFGTIPLIYWPICIGEKRAELVPKEL